MPDDRITPAAHDTIHSRIGDAGFEALVAAFYRQVPGDDVLGPMYPADDLAGAQQRLRDFLIYRFGGPQHYIAQRGHPRLRMRHAPFPIDIQARNRWMQLMQSAMAEVGLPDDVAAALHAFFSDTATFMMNRG